MAGNTYQSHGRLDRRRAFIPEEKVTKFGPLVPSQPIDVMVRVPEFAFKVLHCGLGEFCGEKSKNARLWSEWALKSISKLRIVGQWWTVDIESCGYRKLWTKVK